MKSVISLTLFASVLAISSIARAQDCRWTTRDLRGTYAMSGSGWIDLSKLAANLPPGSVPMSWVGTHTWDGKGGGSGWVAVNAGGIPMSIQLVGLTYSVQADCSVLATYSMKIKELGVTIGPASRIYVVSPTLLSLELFGIQAGAGPGMPVDLTTSRRVSMQ